ncbi:cellulose synthase [Pandoraea cepalis]|uniref:Cellulose synthase n=1 Tax=Pandoraea cepalis TaxID=2508294 RepID=A0A5E4XRQ8_9BURK|nr:cellulose synthase [Pandoraea cepalis]VVE39151.1 cellulose synthase [Pandoraea cepalis]
MTSKQKLTILDVLRREGVSSKTGRPYDMRTAQCVLHQMTSEGKQTIVGTIVLPEMLKETPNGDYLAEFALTQSMEGQLIPRIVSLQPYAINAKPAAQSKEQ